MPFSVFSYFSLCTLPLKLPQAFASLGTPDIYLNYSFFLKWEKRNILLVTNYRVYNFCPTSNQQLVWISWIQSEDMEYPNQRQISLLLTAQQEA